MLFEEIALSIQGVFPEGTSPHSFCYGGAATRTFDGSDGSEADRPGRTGDSHDGTSSADPSSGADSTTERSSEFFASSELFANLTNADDPVMQQLGSFLSVVSLASQE